MIGIITEKAHGDYDPGTSKFFGSPTMPEEWLEDGTVGEDDFFFCQLKISEFKNRDAQNLLPEKGFIYIFLSEKDGDYIPNVRYFDGEPDTIIDDFNSGFDLPEDVETDFSIDFFDTENCNDGTRLLVDNGDTVTLLQYDPLDDNMSEFLSETEKIAYLTISKTDLKNRDFSNTEFSIK